MGFSGDFQKLHSLIAGLRRLSRPAMRSAVNKKLGEKALALVEEGFRRGLSPEGKPWKVPYGGGVPLMRTGALYRSLTLRSDQRGFSISSPLVYAAIQNFGGIIRAKAAPYLVFKIGNRWSKKKQVRIPKKQFLPTPGRIPRAWAREFKELTNGMMLEVMKR
jgi:phage gpG-like protein